MNNNILEKVKALLSDNVDEKTLSSQHKYFKEAVILRGVRLPVVNSISKEVFKEIKDFSKKDIFDLCEHLWQSAYFEDSIIACNWSYYLHEQYTANDFAVFDLWVNKYVSNWASCDTLCNHSVGEFVEMYPEYVRELTKWAKSNNRWVKRAAAVTLIIPARKGLFLNDIFEIADILLLDTDDLVQKAYGWMLKAASEAYQNEVFNYVMSKKDVMPRTALRYAIEKMPKDLKSRAMEKPGKPKQV